MPMCWCRTCARAPWRRSASAAPRCWSSTRGSSTARPRPCAPRGRCGLRRSRAAGRSGRCVVARPRHRPVDRARLHRGPPPARAHRQGHGGRCLAVRDGARLARRPFRRLPRQRRIAGAQSDRQQSRGRIPGLRRGGRPDHHRGRQRPLVRQARERVGPPRMGERSALPHQPRPLRAPRRADPDGRRDRKAAPARPLDRAPRSSRRAVRADQRSASGRCAAADRGARHHAIRPRGRDSVRGAAALVRRPTPAHPPARTQAR